jgi:hypothetical protein
MSYYDNNSISVAYTNFTLHPDHTHTPLKSTVTTLPNPLHTHYISNPYASRAALYESCGYGCHQASRPILQLL